MPAFNIHEAKTNFAKLLERALNGEDIIVAKHGKPLVRLTPITDHTPTPRRWGRHPQPLTNQAKLNALEPFDEQDVGDWT